MRSTQSVPEQSQIDANQQDGISKPRQTIEPIDKGETVCLFPKVAQEDKRGDDGKECIRGNK